MANSKHTIRRKDLYKRAFLTIQIGEDSLLKLRTKLGLFIVRFGVKTMGLAGRCN